MATTPEEIELFVEAAKSARRGRQPIAVLTAVSDPVERLDVGLQFTYEQEDGNIDTKVQYFRYFHDLDEATQYARRLNELAFELWEKDRQ